MIVLLQCSNHHTFWHGKTSQRKTLPPLCVWQQRKHDLTFATHILKEMLETVIHIINQPSILTISRVFALRLVSPSFAYSV